MEEDDVTEMEGSAEGRASSTIEQVSAVGQTGTAFGVVAGGRLRAMTLKRGLWLTLIDEAGEATPVACDIAEKRDGVWKLEALVPPQVYPVTFTAAELRMDGSHLGRMRFPEPIVTRTHETMDLTLEFPVSSERVAAACQGR